MHAVVIAGFQMRVLASGLAFETMLKRTARRHPMRHPSKAGPSEEAPRPSVPSHSQFTSGLGLAKSRAYTSTGPN